MSVETIKKEIGNVANVLKSEIKKDIVQSSNVLNNINKSVTSTSKILKILMTNFADTPKLKYLNHDRTVQLLELEFNKENSKKPYITESNLLNAYKHGKFVERATSALLRELKHEDPHKQAVYSIDCARGNYAGKYGDNTWTNDKAGTKFTEIIIEPFLRSSKFQITQYKNHINYLMDNYDENNPIYKTLEMDTLSTTLVKLLEFERDIDREEFVKPIVAELGPHLKFQDKYDPKEDEYLMLKDK